MSADPGLWPGFQSGVSDYISACKKDRPLRLSIDAPSSSPVSVDGASARAGKFAATVTLRTGQSTKLVVGPSGHRTTYHVRCAPTKLPRWSFDRVSGEPKAQWYLFAPVSVVADASDERSRYVVMVDGNGVPVWWKRTPDSPFNANLLPSGEIAWTRWYGDPFGMRAKSAWEVHRLDGTLVRTLKTVGSPTDTHDMEPLPNGNYLLITYRLRRNVDLRSVGQPANSNVIDGEIQEIAPSGKPVWSWSSRDHVALSETRDWGRIKKTFLDGTEAYDLVHLNSVEPRGNALVISLRNTSAVYRIDHTTGTIGWKLGGTKRDESLRVIGDPQSPTFNWQHDARLLPDGTLTVYDNRSHVGPPRAVSFTINPDAGTATFAGQATDNVHSSGAQGSARQLPGGNWVVNWGGSDRMSELTSSNKVVWRLRMVHAINYRTQPIPFGKLTAASLRKAMDQMYPRKR